MDTKEIKFIVRNISFFSKLKPRDINSFLDIAEIKEYRNGEVIYSEFGLPDYFYLLLRGRIAALTSKDGKDSQIEVLKRGTCFGIISIFTGQPHSVTARSIETSVILKVEKDKFKQFLDKHPVMSLEFFQIFSQRIKKRASPKKIFQCRRVAVLGFPSCGKTTYTRNLGKKLKEETKRKVVCVEFSAQGVNLSALREENCFDYMKFEEVDYLSVNLDQDDNFGALMNFLSENYHFIIYELAFDLKQYSLLAELSSAADFFHILVFPDRAQLAQAGKTVKALKNMNPLNEQKIKIVLCEFKGKGGVSFSEKITLLKHSIYATLPSFQTEEYYKALKRIARELGEIVVGLALGSGGAYAFAHIGVLKVFKDEGIVVDVICGSSMGAFVAALWAAGFDSEQMQFFVRRVGKQLNFFPFRGFSFPFKGFMRARRLENIYKDIFKDMTFYDLKHTLKIAVFDFVKREAKVLQEGLVYKAVAASCAMPGVFEPIVSKKDILLDGGILTPLPAQVLLNYGANKIIAVNVTPSREEIVRGYRKKYKFHILDFIFGSIETMQRQFIEQAVKVCDVVIHPHFEDLSIGWMEFERTQEFVRQGEAAARGRIEEIKKAVL